MNVSYFLTQLSKPFLLLANGIWDLFIRMDSWWSAKEKTTKLHLRYMFLIGIGLSERVETQLTYEDKISVLDNRNTIDRNVFEKEKQAFNLWRLDRLEEDIKDAEKAKEIALKNNEDLQKLLNKRK